MSHYSALIGFDVKALKLASRAQEFEVEAIIVTSIDTFFQSNVNVLPTSTTQGVVELNFQSFVKSPVLLLEITFFNEYNTQLFPVSTIFFHAEEQLLLISETQAIDFKHQDSVFEVQVALNEIEFDAATTLPFVEVNFPDFEFPLSNELFSAHLAIVIQTEGLCVTKFIGSLQGDLSQIIVPFEPLILCKLVFLINIYGIPQQFTLCNFKLQNSELLSKGLLFEVVDVETNLKPEVFRLLDEFIFMINQGQDEAKDANGMKVKLSSITNPQFLYRFILTQNPKLLDCNLPKFAPTPTITKSDDKKLEKILDEEYAMCTNLSTVDNEKYNFSVKGSIMAAIITYPKVKKTEEEEFKDLICKNKSVALVGLKISNFCQDYGFLLISSEQINMLKIIEEFDVGVGNVAVCALKVTDDYLEMAFHCNYSETVKLFSGQKSLVQASKKGFKLYCFGYEMSAPYIEKEIVIKQDTLKSEIARGNYILSEKCGNNASVRLYFEDEEFESNSHAEMKKIEDSMQEMVSIEEAEDDLHNSISSRSSFVTRAYSEKYDRNRYLDYFGRKTKETTLINVNKYIKLLRQFLLEEEKRRKQVEEERRIREEQERLEREEREKEEEERLEEERLEEERLERERLEKELLEQQFYEEMNEKRKNEEQQRLKQMEQINMMKRLRGTMKTKVRARQEEYLSSRPSTQFSVKISPELIEMRAEHEKYVALKSSQIKQKMEQSKEKLKQLQYEFEQMTMEMQGRIEEAQLMQMNAQARLQELEDLELPDSDAEENDFLLEQYKIKKQIEEEHERKMKALEEQFAEQCKHDEEEIIEQKIKFSEQLQLEAANSKEQNTKSGSWKPLSHE